MPFYEVVYEDGSYSVMCTEDDAEALEGISEQHRRATSGEAGGPDGRSAVRVKKVFKYDKHPNDYNVDQELSAKEVTAVTKDAASVPEMIEALRMAVDPLVVSGPHESNFKMDAVEELAASSWGGE